MLKLLSLLTAVAFLFVCAPAQARLDTFNPLWLQHPGNQLRDAGQAVCALPDGSLLVTGWWEGFFDAQLATQPHHVDKRDIFWAKYSPQGQLLWAKSAGSGHCDESADISALSDGTFAVACHYGTEGSTGTFGFGEPNQTYLSYYGMYDIALAKCNPDGSLIWARKMGSNDEDLAVSVAIAPNGGCYIVGFFGTACHFGDKDGVTGNEVVLEQGPPDCFLACYDANGVFKWVKAGSYRRVEALADSTCLADNYGTVCRYSFEGDELWAKESIEGGDAFHDPTASFCVLPDSNQAIFAFADLNVLRKYEFQEDGSTTVVWEKTTNIQASWFPYFMDARPDGSFIVGDFTFNNIYMFDPQGNFLKRNSLTWSSYNQLALNPIDDSIYATCCIWADTTFGQNTPGETSVTARDENGDIIIAKFEPISLYEVKATSEGPGAVFVDPPARYYTSGTDIEVRAVPRCEGYHEFVGWEGDLESYTEPDVHLTIENADVIGNAVFDVIPGAPPMPAVTPCGLLILALVPILKFVRRR